eukprot:4317765-Alexandrium_andersonii.AAC.1
MPQNPSTTLTPGALPTSKSARVKCLLRVLKVLVGGSRGRWASRQGTARTCSKRLETACNDLQRC